MAAYAALVSVMHIIDKLHLHPRPPISLDKKQVESLTQKISFLQEFLEAYNPHLGYSAEADPLESRIADAAYAAEDVIESHIVDRITSHGEKMSSDGLYEGLEKVIEEMDSIEKEAMEIKEKMGVQKQLHVNSMPPDSVRSSSSMMGAADVLREMKDKLTGGRLALQIIPIVGMGGSGKTTLATNIYQDPSMKDHFYNCAWATISQEYSIPEIFTQILLQLDKQDYLQSSENEFASKKEQESEDKLGEMLHKHLFGRKYLIIMDDMWCIQAWEKVARYFPDNKNGSRIVITTRLSNLASELPRSNSLEMRLLDDVESWNLLSRTVFGEKGCPIELEEIGKIIGRSCKGLPLSIVVVGGLLARSEKKREFWEYIKENLNSIVNLVDDERCLRILHMSYKHLPVCLKPCFLYMGIYSEDEDINISKLTTVWASEGFLKPINGKCFEETAREYLKELTDRNMVLIHELGSIGSIKYCKIHDLLRDFCLREAEKERFYHRIVISNKLNCEEVSALQSMSLPRSLIRHDGILGNILQSPSLRLLRIFQRTTFPYQIPYHRDTIELASTVNLRYLDGTFPWEEKLLSSIYRLWDLETLIVGKVMFLKSRLPIEIWCMPQIRHVKYQELYLTDPPSEIGLLRNLHTLKRVINFKCSEEVVKRIPNLKKLQIVYKELDCRSCLSNLVCLHKLESLDCFFIPMIGSDSLQGLRFPQSLKKLKLGIVFEQGWEDILEKIGTLPHLQKLKLYHGHFEACRWETVEGHFRSLKFLEIVNCDDLKEWITESSHFPCLEHLVLNTIDELEEIPLDFAGIATLGLIELKCCSESVEISAKRITEEQEELYGEVWVEVRVM